MNPRPVALPGPVAVVPTATAQENLVQHHPDRSVTVESLVAEMSQQAAAGGLPASINLAKKRLEVYTEHHHCGLYQLNEASGYKLGFVDRKSLRNYHQLSARALLLSSPFGWQAYQRSDDLPQGTLRLRSHWDLLVAAWEQDAPPGREPTTPEHHTAFLSLVTEVVEAARDIEIGQDEPPAVTYRRCASTAKTRRSPRRDYAFDLVDLPSWLQRDAQVLVAGAPDLKGQVRRVDRGRAIIQFFSAVDFDRIPQQGALQQHTSDLVYRTQLAAVDRLQRGEAANRWLLPAFVDGVYEPFEPDRHVEPVEQLDGGQLSAFQRALAVPDQLLILGPPGTGKTRTITEIVAACARRRERILVTSHTNRAVDNVLERLSDELLAVRLGRDDNITAAGRRFMLDAQVSEVRRTIIAATDEKASRLADLAGDGDGEIVRLHRFLVGRVRSAENAQREVDTFDAAIRAELERANPELARRSDKSIALLDRARSRVVEARRKVEQARLLGAQSADDSGSRPVGLIGRMTAAWRAHRLDRRTAVQSTSEAQLQESQAGVDHVEAEIRQWSDNAPEVSSMRARRDAAASQRDLLLQDVARAAAAIERAIEAAGVRVATGDAEVAGVASWSERATALAQAMELARHRARLLEEWRTMVNEAGSELHQELIRYADLVAATCIGTATSPHLNDTDFDVAIVDEAGQIATPTLLVPLVRSRRAILVGDHHQLPPYLDDEVDRWARELGQQTTTNANRARDIDNLVRRSGFEQLYPHADDDHRAMLDVQRRMPEELAGFVSRLFYDGKLRTDHRGAEPCPLFDGAVALVDTADQPERTRREHPVQDDEGTRAGYVNELEAKLIVRIVSALVSAYPDWAVILPYRAQVDLVAELMVGELGSSVVDSVGTVDSFQGGERDLIVFGFTRSNHLGSIGFLRELRRFNVAVTRTRQQLVLIGDTSTLCRARDESFASMMKAFVDHLAISGEVVGSAEVTSRLSNRLLLGRGDSR